MDVGVGRDGLVHISAMSAQPINRVEDVVKEGDTVNVWVRRVDPQAGRIDLTMIEPLGLDWDEIKSGQVLSRQSDQGREVWRLCRYWRRAARG